ncbi:MAG: hypothetical protein AVDCRST_MAG62-1796 [uncultured Sphingomonas sp.]|uniref:Uncharacterized protein n=1 Tax=uncultured Sphingomonas sp. TaxID=158754 RepID=A0A6J4TQT5_9SPHN|nr:MAG: hypothetical protein AVDCRST_MAG62-1796 [uncultured Sphingomonas sp.]
MMSAALLASCNQRSDDSIEPVPAQSAENATRLMNQAEQAAGNAATRSGTEQPTNTMENQQ